MLCRAVARESGARMMHVKPSDVLAKYVGEGEKDVRAVFVSNSSPSLFSVRR
jgi:SpoVK/Ycf46/Vps4 family AAA+-type ATPase